MSVVCLTTMAEENVVAAEWSSLLNGETGNATQLAKWPVKTVQVTGTFGAAGSVQLEGSNDNTNWSILRDSLGVALTFTSAGLKDVLENTQHIRAKCTAGDGTTNLKVRVIAT